MALRIHPDEGRARTPAAHLRSLQQAEPLPIIYHHSTHHDDDGPYVDTTVVWDAAVGRRCRHCPPGRCNLRLGAEGLALCVIRRRGELADIPTSSLSGA